MILDWIYGSREQLDVYFLYGLCGVDLQSQLFFVCSKLSKIHVVRTPHIFRIEMEYQGHWEQLRGSTNSGLRSPFLP